MKDRPILAGAPMLRALLDGPKYRLMQSSGIDEFLASCRFPSAESAVATKEAL